MRFPLQTVIACATVFFLLYLCFPSRTVLIRDEIHYINLATTLSQGETRMPDMDWLDRRMRSRIPADRAPGASLLMTIPLLAGGEWFNAKIISSASLAAATIILALVLQHLHLSPLFSLLLILYLPALSLSRTAMNDPPALLCSTLAIWLILRWRHKFLSFAAGLCCGLSVFFRPTTLLVSLPLLLQQGIRSGRLRLLLLLSGAACGVALFLAFAQWMFGDPLFYLTRSRGFGFAPDNLPQNLLLYAFALLVLLPGSLISLWFYRGPFKYAIHLAALLYSLPFLLYGYNGINSGFPAALVLGPRYFLPLLPLLIITVAHGWHRWLRHRWHAYTPPFGAGLWRRPGKIFLSLAATVLLVCHPLLAQLERPQRRLADFMQSQAGTGKPTLTNLYASAKYFYPRNDEMRLISIHRLLDRSLWRQELIRLAPLRLILLQREQGSFYRRHHSADTALLEQINTVCELRPGPGIRVPPLPGGRALLAAGTWDIPFCLGTP